MKDASEKNRELGFKDILNDFFLHLEIFFIVNGFIPFQWGSKFVAEHERGEIRSVRGDREHAQGHQGEDSQKWTSARCLSDFQGKIVCIGEFLVFNFFIEDFVKLYRFHNHPFWTVHVFPKSISQWNLNISRWCNSHLFCLQQLTRDPKSYADVKSQPHAAVALRLNASGKFSLRHGDIVEYIICEVRRLLDWNFSIWYLKNISDDTWLFASNYSNCYSFSSMNQILSFKYLSSIAYFRLSHQMLHWLFLLKFIVHIHFLFRTEQVMAQCSELTIGRKWRTMKISKSVRFPSLKIIHVFCLQMSITICLTKSTQSFPDSALQSRKWMQSELQ